MEDLPQAEKDVDPFNNAKIMRTIDGTTFYGHVEDIEVGKQSRDRLYRIKYEDGDLEHLTQDEVEECIIRESDKDVSKKPAAMTMPKSKGESAATAKAKAKAKAKVKATAKPKPKAKPKAKAKK